MEELCRIFKLNLSGARSYLWNSHKRIKTGWNVITTTWQDDNSPNVNSISKKSC